MFVYGDSLQSYLVAAVVPDVDEAVKWAKMQGVPGSTLLELCSGAAREKLKEAVHSQMKAASAEAKLAGFEVTKQILLDPELWSVENNMLTPTFKMKRVELKKRYKERFDQLYAAGVPTSPSKL